MPGGVTVVTGGTGLIGRRLVERLTARGERVVVVARHAELAGDVSLPAFGLGEVAWRDLVAQTRAVFHLAARTDFLGADAEAYRPVNVAGALHALELAAAAHAPFHHVSTAFVCGTHRGRFHEADLDAGQAFRNAYERTKHAAERLVVERARALGVPITVYRPGIVLDSQPDASSPSRVGPYLYVDALARLVPRRGELGARESGVPLRVVGRRESGLPLVFDVDVAEAIVALSTRPGGVFHLVPSRPVPNGVLEEAINEAFGRRVVAWSTREEWEASPPSAAERILERKARMYAPYLDLDVEFDRARVDEALGADALPCPTREDLQRVFVEFLGAVPHAQRVAAAASPDVARYFEAHLPEFLGRALLPNLSTLTAQFWIEVGGVAWSIAVDRGALASVRAGEKTGTFGFRVEPAVFLEVVRAKVAPQESFFEGRTQIDGAKVEALRTAVALEEFFRAYPFGGAVATTPEGFVRLSEVMTRPWKEVVSDARRHLNAGLVDLLELGEFTAIDPERAEGASIWDRGGRRIVDMVSSYGALNLGHNHARVRAAMSEAQDACRVDLCKELVSRYAAALARDLALFAPGDLESVFLCNSGAEAIEASLKVAQRSHGGARGTFVYADGAMHGKTAGALSVTGGEAYRGLVRLLPQVRVPYGDADAIARALKAAPAKGEGAIAGVVLEPIQGEAGVIIPPAGYLAAVRALCDRHGALLVLDEVQTAFGRTGAMFACQAEGVVPDILAVAKSLGGGVATIGASIARRDVWRRAYGSPGDCLVQTSTFGGRASACAAAIATLETLVEEELPARAARLGERLLGKLKALALKHPEWIADVRGRGLMIGIEFHADLVQRLGALPYRLPGLSHAIRRHVPGMVAAALLKRHGFLCSLMLNHRSVLRVYPPLVVDEADLDRFPGALDDVLSEGFGALVGGRIRHALSTLGARSFAPWLLSWMGR